MDKRDACPTEGRRDACPTETIVTGYSTIGYSVGIFVTGFGYPVVPQGTARVRCQISAAHTRDDLDQALAAFRKVGARLGLV